MDNSQIPEVVKIVEDKVHLGAEILQGKIPNTDKALGHPIHPATVHWPIAFLSATFGCNALSLLSTTSIYSTKYLPSPRALPLITKYFAAAGVITAIPSIITGLGEGYELVRAQYLQKGSDWSRVIDDSWNMKDIGGRKVKMTVKHASMNDAIVILAGYLWYRIWRFPDLPIPNIALILGAALAGPLLFYSANLGGKLVYEYGVGVQRQGEGVEVKEKMKDQ